MAGLRRKNSKSCLLLVGVVHAACNIAFAAVVDSQKEPQLSAEETVRRGRQVAAMAAAQHTVGQLSTVRFPALPTAWSTMILEDLERHSSIAASNEILRERLQVQLRDTLKGGLLRINESFNQGENQEPWFTDAWLQEQVQAHFGKVIDENLLQNTNTHFQPLFLNARTLASNAQLQSLSLRVYPTADEAEAVIASNWDSGSQQKLASQLTSRMASGVILLEETSQNLQTVADEILRDAREQFQEQVSAMNRPVSLDFRMHSEIAAKLIENVENARLRRKMSTDQDYHLYEIFPTVKRRVASRAESEERERFEAFCTRFEPRVSEKTLSELVQRDLRRHRQWTQSYHACVELLLPDASNQIVTAYAGAVREPVEATRFKARLETVVREDKSVGNAIGVTIQNAARQPLRGVRQSIANQQFESGFPRLKSGRWSVPENILYDIHRREFGVVTFEDCLSLPRASEDGRPFDRDELLEETEGITLAAASKLIAEGETAWKAQLRLVSSFEEEIAGTIREQHAQRSVSEWEEHFIEKIHSTWREKRVNELWRGSERPPEHAAGKYAALFGYATDRIREKVRSEFETATAPTPEPPTPESESELRTSAAPDATSVGPAALVDASTPGEAVPGTGERNVDDEGGGQRPGRRRDHQLLDLAVAMVSPNTRGHNFGFARSAFGPSVVSAAEFTLRPTG